MMSHAMVREYNRRRRVMVNGFRETWTWNVLSRWAHFMCSRVSKRRI